MWEDLAFALSALGFSATTALLLVELRTITIRATARARRHSGRA